MTRDEFMAKAQIWRRYRTRFTWCWFAGLGVFLVWANLPPGHRDLHPAWKACFCIYVLGSVAAMFWLGIRQCLRLGMFCPKCKWGQFFLFNPIATQRILSTGKCRCGHEIIELDDAG
jgi:hypothetical protein